MMKFILTGLLLFSVQVFAEGGVDHVGSGGDVCESRFISIRTDLNSWILKGGAKGLSFPRGVYLSGYVSKMTQNIFDARFSCTNEHLFVGTAEKTCKNFVGSDGVPQIFCNRERFMQTSQSDQYMLVHHEYAGLSGFEANTEDNSHYEISDQIAGYLADKETKKLVITNNFTPKTCEGTPLQSYYDLIPPGIDKRFANQLIVGKTDINVRERTCQDQRICSDWSPIQDESRWAIQGPNGEHGLDGVAMIPEHGVFILNFENSAEEPQIRFFSRQIGSERFYFTLDCGVLGDFNGTCQVHSNWNISGSAYGKIMDHCAWFIFYQRFYKDKNTWIEREVVVSSSYN